MSLDLIPSELAAVPTDGALAIDVAMVGVGGGLFAAGAAGAGLTAATGSGGGASVDGALAAGGFTSDAGAGIVFAGAVGALIEKLDPEAPKEPEPPSGAAGATTAATAPALFQPGGGSIITMLSHLGQDKICPITDSSVTLSRALQVVQ